MYANRSYDPANDMTRSEQSLSVNCMCVCVNRTETNSKTNKIKNKQIKYYTKKTQQNESFHFRLDCPARHWIGRYELSLVVTVKRATQLLLQPPVLNVAIVFCVREFRCDYVRLLLK